MPDSLQKNLILLRLIVGGLGERKTPKWWESNFSSKTSEPFLTPVFPRSTRLAQYHALCAAAIIPHDHFIGVGKTYHLFRLPEELEQGLHETLIHQLGQPGELDLGDNGALETVLESLTERPPKNAEGPTCVGTHTDLFKPDIWRHVGGLYLAAFSAGIKTFPYFKEDP